MNFEFTEEQNMLRDTLSSFLRDRHSFDYRRKIVGSESTSSSELWNSFASELGILGAALPEDIGGFGGGSTENIIVMEELGKALSLEPWLESIVMAGSLLGGSEERAQDTMRAVIAGDALVIPAINYFPSSFGTSDKTVAVTGSGENISLTGEVPIVRNACLATHFVVCANSAGTNELSLFLVPAGSPGVSLRHRKTVDGARCSDLVLQDVSLDQSAVVASGTVVQARLDEAFDMGVAALCAEALGIQRKLLEWTVEYAKQRKQFGRAIGDFQALQHRMAEMFVKVEESASMTYMLAARLSEHSEQRPQFTSAAKILIDQSSRFIGQSAVQIHGGMGMSKELPVADYFTRLVAISQQLGSTEFHFRRYETASFQ